MLKSVSLDHLRIRSKTPRRLWLLGLALVGGLALSWAINSIWWNLILDERPPQQVVLVIPPGTSRRVAAGEAIPSIPAEWVFGVGDVLLLRNEDEADHAVGPFWVPAGTTARIPFEGPGMLSFLCTIHPNKYIGVAVKPRADPLLKLATVFMLGLPIAGLMSLAVLVSLSELESRSRASPVSIQ